MQIDPAVHGHGEGQGGPVIQADQQLTGGRGLLPSGQAHIYAVVKAEPSAIVKHQLHKYSKPFRRRDPASFKLRLVAGGVPVKPAEFVGLHGR